MFRFQDFQFKEDDEDMKVSYSADYTAVLHKLKKDFDDKWHKNKPSASCDFSQFDILKILGAGAFGTVKLLYYKPADRYYATKMLFKAAIIKQKQLEHTLYEKKILCSVRFPFTVYAKFTCKDNDFIYFGMPFINGGEMFIHLRKVRRFDELHAKFYAAQVALALEYLHHLDLVYRDLKPENILLDFRGYLKITDFGFCKMIKGRTWTLCGTPEYVAPEIIQTRGYGKSVDWWSFGVLVYEMVAGVSPFYTPQDDPMVLFARIVDGKYRMPSFFSADLKNFIHNILQYDLTRRYGNLKNGASDVKNHVWFKHVNWIALLNQDIEAPFIPKVASAGDATNFDNYNDYKFQISKKIQYEKEFAEF